MHRDVTLVAIKSSNKLKYLKLEERKLKTAKKSCYSFKRFFELGDKQFRVIYTLRILLPSQNYIILGQFFTYSLACAFSKNNLRPFFLGNFFLNSSDRTLMKFSQK